MKLLAFIIALICIGFSVAGFVRPDVIARMVTFSFSPVGLYVVALVRCAIGLIFFLGAFGSRAPRALRVIGIMICIVGVALAVFTAQRGGALVEWWATEGVGVVRWAIPFAFALGVFVAYATAPRRY
jgi:hypothetical protein